MKSRLLLAILTTAVALSGLALFTTNSATTNSNPASTNSAAASVPVPAAAPDPDSAQVVADRNVVSVDVFHEPLARYGRWTTVPQYSYVWEPVGVAAGWGPYVDGSWAYTDYGWTWVSDDPWGWATCHYGRWYLDPAAGWMWIPGTEWGPAWVDWSFGDGFIGWAPLSPAFGWGYSGLIGFAPIPVGWYSFVRIGDFDDHHVGRFIVPWRENAGIFSHARRVTDYGSMAGRVVNRSISRQQIEQATGRRVQTRMIRDVNSPRQAGNRLRGNEISMFRPNVSKGGVQANRPGATANGAVTTNPSARVQAQQQRNFQRGENNMSRPNMAAPRRQEMNRQFQQRNPATMRQQFRTQAPQAMPRQFARPQMRTPMIRPSAPRMNRSMQMPRMQAPRMQAPRMQMPRMQSPRMSAPRMNMGSPHFNAPSFHGGGGGRRH